MRAGVARVQIRDRELEGADLLVHARALCESARAAARAAGSGVEVIVNRRVDVALAIEADGVHLGFDGLAPDDVRTLWRAAGSRSTPTIGVSAHSLREVEEAAASGAHYVHLAPIFEPLSKPSSRPALGLEVLARAAGVGIPVVAQGGIAAANLASVLTAGARGAAVTGSVLAAADPGRAVGELLAAAGA